MRTRGLLAAAGLALAAYGGWLLAGLDGPDLRNALVWLVGGVLLHDAVLAPLVIVVGLLVARTVPGAWRAPLAVGLLVLGTATLAAVPVLGRFGAPEGNPTVLSRDYAGGWLVVAALTAVGVTAAGLAARRRRSRGARAGG